MPQQPPVALVTGSARRIGAAINRRLHAAGFTVVIHCHRSRSEADALAGELNQLRPDSAFVLQGDLLDLSLHQAWMDEITERFGRLDVLVNNASTFYPTPAGSISEAQWNDLVGSNLKAPLFLSQAALPALRKNHGCIINIIDIHIEHPLADHPVYLAAKAGLHMLTRSLAKDLGPGVRVNGVSPGTILWPESEQDDKAQQAIIDATPLQRIGKPEDIANAVLFLANSEFITGEIIRVDGGRGI